MEICQIFAQYFKHVAKCRKCFFKPTFVHLLGNVKNALIEEIQACCQMLKIFFQSAYTRTCWEMFALNRVVVPLLISHCLPAFNQGRPITGNHLMSSSAPLAWEELALPPSPGGLSLGPPRSRLDSDIGPSLSAAASRAMGKELTTRWCVSVSGPVSRTRTN